MTDIFVIYNDESQIKRIENISPIFHFIDSMSRKGKKKAWEIKSHWAAKLDPFILIKDGDKVVKVFYSETGEDVIGSLIDYLNNEKLSKS